MSKALKRLSLCGYMKALDPPYLRDLIFSLRFIAIWLNATCGLLECAYLKTPVKSLGYREERETVKNAK